MEHEPTPTTVTIKGETFDIVKPTRLLPGMVLRSQERDAYARLGPKQTALEEQIHTVSLHKRGFPVAQVLDSGEHDADQWYFVEESLGDESYHDQFAREWSETGAVGGDTFAKYAAVVQRYIDAQFAPANRTTVSADEFVAEAIPDERIVANYLLCGGDVNRYHEAVTQATKRIAELPMGILQLDLNPFNVLERGIIDFELVSYGPIGYDSLTVSLWHRWFMDDQNARYKLAYMLSKQQIDTIAQMVSTAADQHHLPNPLDYMQEFLLIKSAWGFSSFKSITDEPASKQNFYRYRAAVLTQCIDQCLAGETIDPLTFPNIKLDK